jgi:hypothetical protein
LPQSGYPFSLAVCLGTAQFFKYVLIHLSESTKSRSYFLLAISFLERPIRHFFLPAGPLATKARVPASYLYSRTDGAFRRRRTSRPREKRGPLASLQSST